MSILGHQAVVRKEQDIALAGQVLVNNMSRTYVNMGEVAQVTAIAVGTIAAANYTITVGGINVVVPILGSDTDVQARDKIIAALTANMQVYANFTMSVADDDVLLMTCRHPNYPVTISVSGGGSGFAAGGAGSVAAAPAQEIPFGRVVATRAGDADLACRLPTQSGDRPVGFAALSRGLNGLAYPSRSTLGVLEDGELWAPVEISSGIRIDDPVFYRHTANGGNTQIGICANASGTGRSQFLGCLFKSVIERLDSGVFVAKVKISR